MQQILMQIARQNGVSLKEVEAEIAMAIRLGMECTDTQVQQCWAKVPKSQEIPTAEEVIAFVAAQIQEIKQTEYMVPQSKSYETAARS